MTNTKSNDVTVAGTDFFADSETFLNELTNSELDQIRGGQLVGPDPGDQSNLTLILCDALGPI